MAGKHLWMLLGIHDFMMLAKVLRKSWPNQCTYTCMYVCSYVHSYVHSYICIHVVMYVAMYVAIIDKYKLCATYSACILAFLVINSCN